MFSVDERLVIPICTGYESIAHTEKSFEQLPSLLRKHIHLNKKPTISQQSVFKIVG